MSVSLYYLIAGKEEFSTKLQKALYMGSLIGILSIIAWYFVSPEAILKISFGFFSGSENTVSTGFALLFKTLGESDTDNPDFSAAIRHEIASLLIVLAFILRFISVSFDKNISTNSSLAKNRRIIEFIVYIFVMIITFMTLSRQSILSGFFMVYYVIFMNSKTQLKILGTRLLKNNNFGIKILLFFIIILLVAALNFDSFLKLVSILYERFFEDTKAYDDRIGLNETALKLISENIFIGIGMGEKFSVGSREMLQIHNFFLATWIQSGIFGLISATYMHISLFLYCFYSSYHQYKLRLHEYSNHLNIEYVLALAFFPLMRSYYASNSFQSIVDWLTIGICLGFVELNKNIIHSKNMNASRSVKIQQEM